MPLTGVLYEALATSRDFVQHLQVIVKALLHEGFLGGPGHGDE